MDEKDLNEMLDNIMNDVVECPICGWAMLVERRGQYGEYYGYTCCNMTCGTKAPTRRTELEAKRAALHRVAPMNRVQTMEQKCKGAQE